MDARVDINKMLETQFRQLSKKGSPGLAIEGMRLLVHLEKELRMSSGKQKFECEVIQLSQLDAYLAHLAAKKSSSQHALRSQVIVVSGDHYTTVDFQLSDQGNECIILDARGDPRWTVIKKKLEQALAMDKETLLDRIYIVHGATSMDNIQHDFHSCLIFALDHAIQISKLPDIYKKLDSLAINTAVRTVQVDWLNMPPQLVWNAQSVEWLNKYKRRNPDWLDTKISETDMTFSEYIEAGMTAVGTSGKVENASIPRLFQSCQKRAGAALNSIDEKRLLSIVAGLQFHVVMENQDEGFGAFPPIGKSVVREQKVNTASNQQPLGELLTKIICCDKHWKKQDGKNNYDVIEEMKKAFNELNGRSFTSESARENAMLEALYKIAIATKTLAAHSGMGLFAGTGVQSDLQDFLKNIRDLYGDDIIARRDLEALSHNLRKLYGDEKHESHKQSII